MSRHARGVGAARRPRTATRLLPALVVVLTVNACGGEDPQPGTDPADDSPDPVETTAACDPVESPPQQPGGHLLGDEEEPPVPYSSTPPTSGWHASGAFSIEVHPPDDPLPEPRQVSVLEAGGVVVAYRDLDEATRTELEAHVREHHPGRVAVTPYDGLEPGQVAFTAWGTLQRCDGLSPSALDAFVAEHADEEPAVPGTH